MITPFDDNYKRIDISIDDLGDDEFINIGDANIESIDVIIEGNNIVSDDYRTVVINYSNLNLYDGSKLNDVIIDWSDYLDNHYRLKDIIDSLTDDGFSIMCIMN